ncbi:MAG: hypothetical protein GY906_13080 [bacterium]|nr:hypothetical protein [bacterium]
MKRLSTIVVVIAIVAIALVGCTSPPTRTTDSPGTAGGSSTAFQAQGAQTIGGDQGQAETPQTNTTGTATNQLKFASEGVDTGIAEMLVNLAAAQKWSADQLAAIFKSMNGAPENVTITIDGGIQATSGDGENVGSSGGTGGSQTAKNPKND